MVKAKLVDQLFREGLRGARLRFGADRGRALTPDELGEMVGKSGQTIRNYERGETEPELNKIEKLRVALRAPAEWPPFASYVPLETVQIPKEDEAAYPPPKELLGPPKTKRRGNGRRR